MGCDFMVQDSDGIDLAVHHGAWPKQTASSVICGCLNLSAHRVKQRRVDRQRVEEDNAATADLDFRSEARTPVQPLLG